MVKVEWRSLSNPFLTLNVFLIALQPPCTPAAGFYPGPAAGAYPPPQGGPLPAGYFPPGGPHTAPPSTLLVVHLRLYVAQAMPSLPSVKHTQNSL